MQANPLGDVEHLVAGAHPQRQAPGDQGFTFICGRAFGEVAGQLRLDNGILQGDVDGDGVADFEIEMAGVAALGGGDFLL